jgi:hypothetical protein
VRNNSVREQTAFDASKLGTNNQTFLKFKVVSDCFQTQLINKTKNYTIHLPAIFAQKKKWENLINLHEDI